MSIDEIHLFTEKGEIYSGTVPIYYGYTFDSGDQMAYFKPMLQDKKLSLCQDVTPNTAENKPMMYAICWNDSGTRMIQVGIEPKRLIEEMQSNAISQVVSNIPAYEGVDIVVADRSTKEILGATDETHIGETLSDIGLSGDYNSAVSVVHFSAYVEGKKAYCSMHDMGNYIIAVVQDRSVVNREIPFTVFLIFVYLTLAATALAIIVKRTTDRRERLQAISERAIAASEAKSSFLSNMSHEIRTPINAILGMNEMIMRECGEEDTDIRMYSQNIKTAGSTLLGIVNDILDFSKIEEGKLEIIPVDYDLSSVMNDLVNMIKTKLDDKGLFLKLDFQRSIPRMLHGDEIRIKQIITNILSNAANYTEKGSVTFSVSYEKAEDDPNAILLHVSVKDTGIGIKPEDIEKLFSRFERIEEKRNRSIEGAGLGMNITKMLLEMMGSFLMVESTYGEGSRFSFILRQEVVKWDPIGDYETTWKQSVMAMSAYRERLVAPEAEILVVDDNSLNLMVFASLLKQTGIRIDKAASGDEGIAYALKKHYDMIFLDHMMPEKDGIETLHELKANPQGLNLGTPCICLTANAISGAREEYIEAGFNDYLTKPINTEELENMLIRYLPEGKIQKQQDTGKSDQDFQENTELPEEIKVLGEAGINVEAGMKNSGSIDSYRSVLEIFHAAMEEKRDEIEKYYRNGDMKSYTIKVHALKSSARIIGAAIFGEEAQMLEDAGKRDDIDYIRGHHEAFLKQFMELKEPISKALVQKNENAVSGPTADGAIMAVVYEKLKTAAEDMDCDMLEQVFDEMKDYNIPENEQKLYQELKTAAMNFKYDTILQLLEGS